MQAFEIPDLKNVPINLSQTQITNPLSVFDDFFSDDSLSGHLQRLKDWRSFVLKDDYYRDMKGAPAGLLYFHKLNICLIEAAFLIKDTNIAGQSISITSIKTLFEGRNLSWYRDQLYEWLEHGLSTSGVKEFIETTDLIFIYEGLQQLYEAAWLIYEATEQSDAAIIVREELNNSISVYRLNSIPSEAYSELIKALVSKIKHKLPTVQTIIDLGTTPFQPDKVFLLVLTADDERETAQSLCSMLEESCQEIADLTVMVHYRSNFLSGISKGHTFFCSALKCPAVYLSGELLLPTLDQIEHVPDDCLNYWERWYTQGENFFAGAEFFIGRKAYEAALFCLHQCAESMLTAVVRVGLGYRINNHNLSRLLKLTQLFTNGLSDVFTVDELELFQLLKACYTEVRYRDNFEADGKSVEALIPIISRLKRKTAQIYQAHLLANTL